MSRNLLKITRSRSVGIRATPNQNVQLPKRQISARTFRQSNRSRGANPTDANEPESTLDISAHLPKGGANPLKCYLSRSPLVSIANSWQAGRSTQVTIVLSNVYVNRFICICAAVLSLKDTFIITHTHNYTDRRQFSKTCDITWSTKQCFPPNRHSTLSVGMSSWGHGTLSGDIYNLWNALSFRCFFFCVEWISHVFPSRK